MTLPGHLNSHNLPRTLREFLTRQSLWKPTTATTTVHLIVTKILLIIYSEKASHITIIRNVK